MKAILFDFDGTLADTLDIVVSVLNDMAAHYRLRPTSRDEIKRRGTRETFDAMGISTWRLPKLVIEARGRMHALIGEATLFHEIPELIRDLHAGGVRLGILTSNSAENVTAVLRRYGIEGCFDEIVAGSSLFGKARLLKKLVKKMKVSVADVTYVGDEARDVVACREVGVPVVAVGWGFESAEVLKASEPGAVVAEVADLRRVLATTAGG